MVRSFFLALTLISATALPAQTCCSGGVPLATNLGLPAGESRAWQLSLQYDLNQLTRLYAGSERFEDSDRRRRTHTGLLTAGYSPGERWQLEVVVPYIQQERRIAGFGSTNTVRTRGIGDAVLLARYHILPLRPFANWQWSVGAGAKAPTGASDQRTDNGIALNADLQPGSGAWDGLLWQRLSHQTSFRPSLTTYLQGTYRYRGTNHRYLPVTDRLTGEERFQSYRFGTEWQLQVGAVDQLLLGSLLLEPGLALRYRAAAPDRTNDVVTPGTGGDFLFLQPSLGWAINADRQLRLAADLPAYTRVGGTQLAPTFRINLGLRARLGGKTDQ